MDTAFTHLLAMLGDIADRRRAEGKLYGLPHVFLFSILAVMAGTGGYLDDIPVSAVAEFERGLIAYMNSAQKDLIDRLRSSGKLEDDIKADLEAAITKFKSTFKPAAS